MIMSESSGLLEKGNEMTKMIKITMDLDLWQVSENAGGISPNLADTVKAGDDIASHLDNDVRPVSAIVIDPHGSGGGMAVVCLTFLDDDHAIEWMGREGMDGEDIRWYLRGSETLQG
jgi:hypothetical protein